MKKATNFNLVLGIINIFFFVVIAVCSFLLGGIEGIVNWAKGIIEYGMTYFLGITTLWGGDIIKIAIFACLALLTLITLILMIASIAKKQGYFWEPLSILCLAVMGAIVYKDPSVVLGVTSVATDLVYGLKCIATCAAILGVFIYMIIAVSVISAKKKKVVVPETKEEVEEEVKEEPAEEVVVEETPSMEEEVVEEEIIEEEMEEEPKVEEIPAPQVKKTKPAPAKEVEQPARESKPVFIIDENGNKVYPGRDFEDRLYESNPELLQMYSDLKNEFLSYRKIHTRVSKTNDAFRFEGQLVGKMIVSGKGLKVYLALDPMSLDSAIYHQKDASGKKKFVETPFEVKVKSPLSYRKAKQLIALAMEQVGTVRKTRYTPIDWTKPNAKEKVEA